MKIFFHEIFQPNIFSTIWFNFFTRIEHDKTFYIVLFSIDTVPNKGCSETLKNNIPQLLVHIQHPHSLLWVVLPPKMQTPEHEQMVEQDIEMSSIFTV